MKKLVLLFVALLAISHLALGQPPPPEPNAIPIDGGLAFLIVAGATYGARKIYKERKKQEG